jgi:hypothetical protein
MALSFKERRAPRCELPTTVATAPSRHVAVCAICETYAGEATPGVPMAEQYRAPWAANGIHRGQTCTHGPADWLMCTEAEARLLVESRHSTRGWAGAHTVYTGVQVPRGADRAPAMRTHGGARYVAVARLPRPGDRPERPAERKVPGGVVRRTRLPA